MQADDDRLGQFFAAGGLRRRCGSTVPVGPGNCRRLDSLMGSAPGNPRRRGWRCGGRSLPQTLATPGEATSCWHRASTIPGNKSQTAYDMAGATQAVADAAAMGIPTFVLGVGTGGGTADAMVFDPTLTSLAAAGGKARAGTPNYYHVSSSADVVAALAMIQGQANSCVFNLASVPPDPTNVAVRAAGNVKIPQDRGWDYGRAESIRLYGNCRARRRRRSRTFRRYWLPE
jgi:hypothetical protein